MADHWRELVTTSMLGTDRRDPPVPVGPLADVVADALRPAPSERMLAQVAACTAIRRAGVLPGPPVARLQGPDVDERPVCIPAAIERWHHITVSWPVLEDEWMLTLIVNGWRVAPELVPAILQRHRSDPLRRARAEVACGPLASWLVGHVPELAARSTHHAVDPESLGELPELPIAPGLVPLLTLPGSESAAALAGPDRHRRTRCRPSRRGGEPPRPGPTGCAGVDRLGARIDRSGCAGVRPRLGARRPRHHPPSHARRTLPVTGFPTWR